ncbi:MAG TPA: hypothetical protein VMP03_06960 [Methylomirabilota bacterium]|nr:hypothetical protein [Methylomirabilota bacterium]
MRARPTGDAGYRRGLVLGLTMAELMLLLVFCLLIALAALMAANREKLTGAEEAVREANARAETAEASLSELSILDRLAEQGSRAAAGRIDDTWRRLVRDGALGAAAERAGLTAEVLERDGAFLAEIAPLAGEATAADVVEAVAVARAARHALALPADASADQVRARAGAIAEEVAALQARPGRSVDLPPILILREDRGYYFETGSAVPSEAFAARLHDETAAELARLIRDYDVDVIEVIGHTDERPVANRTSNLDETLLGAVRGGPIDAMVPSDNAGLGLARAVAVARELRSDPRLSDRQILPMSAAQLIGTDGALIRGDTRGDVRERRRIEIRLRRSTVAN